MDCVIQNTIAVTGHNHKSLEPYSYSSYLTTITNNNTHFTAFGVTVYACMYNYYKSPPRRAVYLHVDKNQFKQTCGCENGILKSGA
jgi:hypothetical protein